MKKIKLIFLSSFTASLLLSGCGGGGSSSNYVDPDNQDSKVQGYSLKGVAFDGPLYNSKVIVYDKNGEKIAQTIIENESGFYAFKELKSKPALVKVEDGIDLGVDGKKGGGDDTFFDDVLFAKVNGSNVNVTPLTTLEYYSDSNLDLGDGYSGEDLKEIIAIRNVIRIIKAAGLSSEEAYKIVSKSVSNDEEFIVDGSKLEENLKETGVSLDVITEIIENLKDVLSNLPKDLDLNKMDEETKADIYSVETAVNAIKNTLEAKPVKDEELKDIEQDLPKLLEPSALENIKEALLETNENAKEENKEVDIGEFSKSISNVITQDPKNIETILYSAPPKVPTTCSSTSKSLRFFGKNTRNGSVEVTCGPNPETVKMWLDCDNDGVLIKNICSTTGNLCKICDKSMIKEIKVQRRYLRVREIGTPTIDQKFNAIKDYLKDLFTFELIDFGSSLNVDERYIVTVVLRRIDKCSCKAEGYITASLPVEISKENREYVFKIPANSKLFITSNTGQMGQLVITKKISSERKIACQNGTLKINLGDYIDKMVSYAGNSSYAQDAKEMIYKYTTQPGLFEVYFMVNGTNSKDILKNPYLFDATKYQLDLNPYNQSFSNQEHAFKVTIGLN